MVFALMKIKIANELKRVWLVPFKCRPILLPTVFPRYGVLIEVAPSKLIFYIHFAYQMFFCSICIEVEWRWQVFRGSATSGVAFKSNMKAVRKCWFRSDAAHGE